MCVSLLIRLTRESPDTCDRSKRAPRKWKPRKWKARTPSGNPTGTLGYGAHGQTGTTWSVTFFEISRFRAYYATFEKKFAKVWLGPSHRTW